MTARNKLTAALLPVLTSLVLLLGSCVTSLHLLGEDEKDLVFRPELVGRWEMWNDGMSAEKETYYAVVTLDEDSLYHIMTVMNDHYDRERKDTSYFFGFLVEVDGLLFLNCLADTNGPHFRRVGEYTRETLMHTDYICLLNFRNNGEVLEFWQLENTSGLKAMLDEKKIAYTTPSEYTLLLLEPTTGLKRLMVQLVKEYPEYWDKRLLLRADSSFPLTARP